MFMDIDGTTICLRHVAAIGPVDWGQMLTARKVKFSIFLTGGTEVISMHDNAEGARAFRAELMDAVKDAHR